MSIKNFDGKKIEATVSGITAYIGRSVRYLPIKKIANGGKTTESTFLKKENSKTKRMTPTILTRKIERISRILTRIETSSLIRFFLNLVKNVSYERTCSYECAVTCWFIESYSIKKLDKKQTY
jgi:hypothetical protein